MRIVVAAIAVLAYLGMGFFMKNSWTLKDSALPPLGTFLSPFTGFWQNADPVDPSDTRAFEVSGLTGEATIFWDERGVPHIEAGSYRDAIFLQGYAHARDRLWQMDFSARATAGRLSEILGEKALDYDRERRRKGLADAARRTVEAWVAFDESYQLVEAYTAGVNAYIDQLPARHYPIEFKLLQYEPERWSPYKTSLFFKSMSDVLSARNHDLELSNARALLGAGIFHELYPEDHAGSTPVIPAGTAWDFEPVPAPDTTLNGLDGVIFRPGKRDRAPVHDGVGSNSWAVAPSKTKSGHAMLCNDPHLTLSLPSVWYECHIVCPETNVRGASFPGAPGVIIGFNENSAWGFTNGGIDVLDWYELSWDGPERRRYRVGEEWVAADYRLDTFHVKNSQPYIDSVRITRFGPVYTEAEDSPYAGMAMHWMALETPDTDELRAFWGLNMSQSVADYRETIKGLIAPMQNIIYADREGNIALTVQGRFPLKGDQEGRFIQDGRTAQPGWTGYIPAEHVPAAVNPEAGFLSSANQRVADGSYPYYFNSGDFRDYRGRRINRLLGEMEDITPEDMMRMQGDNTSLHAQLLLEAMLHHLPQEWSSAEGREWADRMRAWKGDYEAGLVEPVFFEAWLAALVADVWDELTGPYPDTEVALPPDWLLAQWLTERPAHPVFDRVVTPHVETADKLVVDAFGVALKQVTATLAAQPDLDWGRQKATRIGHLARIDAFSTDTLYCGGTGEAINAVKKTKGPSWRMVVELGDEMRAWCVYPGGQSGNPGSRLYDNMVDDWRDAKYHKVGLSLDPGKWDHPLLSTWTLKPKQ